MSEELEFDASGCMICGENNADGMKFEFTEAPPEGAKASGKIPEHFKGFSEIAHGGSVAGILDDVMWWAIYFSHDACTLTGELKVRYLKPVPVETPIIVHGWVKESRGRLYKTAASLYLKDGEELAKAEATFLISKD